MLWIVLDKLQVDISTSSSKENLYMDINNEVRIEDR
jgi:hypothetical protein